MTEVPDAQRPHGRDHEPAPEEQQRPQQELDKARSNSGGDADAAGSVDEREAIAADEDDTWGSDEG